jgi:hypothetical protein
MEKSQNGKYYETERVHLSGFLGTTRSNFVVIWRREDKERKI